MGDSPSSRKPFAGATQTGYETVLAFIRRPAPRCSAKGFGGDPSAHAGQGERERRDSNPRPPA